MTARCQLNATSTEQPTATVYAEQLQTPGLAAFVIDTLLLVVVHPTTPLTLLHVSERQAQGPGALPTCSHMRRSD